MPKRMTLIGKLARSFLTNRDRKRLPGVDGTLKLEGVHNPVEIIRDGWGVPHIYANSLEDLCFAQGFVHAQDRLLQMEFNRRTSKGTLSELFGEAALDTDRTARTFGFHRLGLLDWEAIHGELRDGNLAYAAGVNAFLDQKKGRLPFEFNMLSHRPDPWTPEDTLAFSRLMIWQLSHAWQGELIRAEVAEKVGSENAAALEIDYPKQNPIALPRGIEFNRLDPDGSLTEISGPFLGRGKGSNSWVVSPNRSQTGNAVLCNDMHLALSIPSLWYMVHLISVDGFHVSGVSLPGLPLVLVGHNEKIAWGMTLAFTDAEDLFIEQIDSQNRYLFKDQWHPVEVIDEVIEVKGRVVPHLEKVMVTRHGPVISNVVGTSEHKIAVNSMALRPCQVLEGWYKLNRAGGWDEFVDAMRLIEAPQLSITYADVEDNIGYWVSGIVPKRSKGNGTVPVPGWSGEYEWVGVVPFEEMPHAINPQNGYLVTCNHKIVGEDYPHFLGNVWMNGYRARRLTDLIESRNQLSIEDHMAFQMDVKCLPGLEFVSKLDDLTDPDPDVQLALQLLRDWDGHLTPESVGGTIYEVTRYTIVRNMMEQGLGPDLTSRWMGVGFHPLLNHSNEFYGHDTVVMLRLLDDPGSWWVKVCGGRDILLSRSLKSAINWLRKNLGPNETNWTWGSIHQVNFEHALSLRKPFDQVYDRGPFPIGGDTDTPMQTAIHPKRPYDNRAWSPTFRQIVDMGDLSRSWIIIPPGQSSHVASPHYDDLIQPWLKGEYLPMLWTREQVEAEAVGRLTIKSED